jgi:hypothetical protein
MPRVTVKFRAKKEVDIGLQELRMKYIRETQNPKATTGDAVEDLLRKNGLLPVKGVVI